MNIEMVAVNIAVVSLVFIPYFLLIYLGQREYRRINSTFIKEAKIFGLNIDFKGRWNQNAIGLDSKQQHLLFVQKQNDSLFVDHIKLSSIARCKLIHQIDNININGIKDQVLQNVTLDLIHFNGTNKSICLFDSEYLFDQDMEMKNAEQWRGIISSNLTLNYNKPQVA